MPYVWAGAALIVAVGYATDKIGDGVNDTGTGAIKLSVAGAVALGAFIVAKNTGFIK